MFLARILVSTALAVLAGLPALAAPEAKGCDAAALAPLLKPQPGLPKAVAATRLKIMQAAVRCDYAALEKLTRPAGPEFSYTLGMPEGPANFWREMRAASEIVKLFSTRPVKSEGDYIWPAAYGNDTPSEADWQDLRRMYGAMEIQDYREQGYMGMRAMIDAKGVWRYCIAGD